MLELRTEIDIAASPERVYAVLAEFDRYAEWNPFITRAKGRALASQRFSMHMEPPGGKPMDFKPWLLCAEPGVELRWIGRMLVPGLFDGEHYFRLSPSAAGTQLLHGEVFRGILIPFFRKDLETKVRAGFEQMNRALKDRAEAG